jgi:signal transduction histidine kinase
MQFVKGTMESNKIKINLTCKHDFEIYGYPNMLSHVLLNLLNNSRDVLYERNIKNPTIWIRVIKYKQVYKIIVLDNGKGVEKEISNKIFDPYFTTKKFNKGSGLGLYMAKTMIEKQMNGRIEFKNKEEGAEFKISFDLIN